MLKTGRQWLKYWGDQLIAPDGWRYPGWSLDDPISYSEYLIRMAKSTTYVTDSLIARYNGLRETTRTGVNDDPK